MSSRVIDTAEREISPGLDQDAGHWVIAPSAAFAEIVEPELLMAGQLTDDVDSSGTTWSIFVGAAAHRCAPSPVRTVGA